MKVGIIFKDIWFDKEKGMMCEIEVPDPDLEESPQRFICKKDDLITFHAKEWSDQQTA